MKEEKLVGIHGRVKTMRNSKLSSGERTIGVKKGLDEKSGEEWEDNMEAALTSNLSFVG